MKTLREYIDALARIEEGGITLPNPDGSLPPGAFTADDQVKLNQRMQAQASGATAGGVPIGSTPPGINRLTGKPIEPAADKPAASGDQPVPLSKRFDPRLKQTGEPYTIDVDGKQYKWAGREASAPGQGEVIKVPAANVGIRGLGAVNVELGSDGKYYNAGK